MIGPTRELLCHCGKPLSVARAGNDLYMLGHLDSLDCMGLTGDAEDVLSEFMNNGLSAPTEEEKQRAMQFRARPREATV